MSALSNLRKVNEAFHRKFSIAVAAGMHSMQLEWEDDTTYIELEFDDEDNVSVFVEFKKYSWEGDIQYKIEDFCSNFLPEKEDEVSPKLLACYIWDDIEPENKHLTMLGQSSLANRVNKDIVFDELKNARECPSTIGWHGNCSGIFVDGDIYLD